MSNPINLLTPRPTEAKDELDRIVKYTGLTEGVVRGVLGDCAAQKGTKETQSEIALRWGLPFGKITTVRCMGKLTIADIREGVVTKSSMIVNEAQDALMDKFNQPEERAKMSAKDLSTISKQQADLVINMSNNSTGGGNVAITNIGDVKMLIQLQNQNGEKKDAMERLRERGVNVDKLADSIEDEVLVVEADIMVEDL